jgi:hypothetical protein
MPRSQRPAPIAGDRAAPRVVERVQTGVRIEKRILKVLKAVAEYHEITLGDVIEGIVLHAFDGKPAFGADGLGRIREFRRLYRLDLDSSDSHRMIEAPGGPRASRSAGRARSAR